MKTVAAAALIVASLTPEPPPDLGYGYTIMCAASASDTHVEHARMCWPKLRFADAAGCRLAAHNLNTPHDPVHHFCRKLYRTKQRPEGAQP